MKITKNALINAVLAVGYIVLVVSFLNNASKIFGQEDNILMGMTFLLLLVISVALMGLIVFGRPILWYLDGFKKEAVRLIFSTVGFMACALLILFVLLLLIR